jgi:hypothetical protein
MQNGGVAAGFGGDDAIVLAGSLDRPACSFSPAGAAKPLQARQHVRVEEVIEHPQQAVEKAIQLRVADVRGNFVATQTIKGCWPGNQARSGWSRRGRQWMWFKRRRQAPMRSLVCDGSVVRGELRFADDLCTDGEVHGDLLATRGSNSPGVITEKPARAARSKPGM